MKLSGIRHRTLSLLLSQRLTHVLTGLSFHVLEVERALLASCFPLKLKVYHLILQKGLDFLIFPLLYNLVSFLLDTKSSRVIIDHLPPELVLSCVLCEAYMARFLRATVAIRSVAMGYLGSSVDVVGQFTNEKLMMILPTKLRTFQLRCEA